MNILVTVGSSSFDSLIRTVDLAAKNFSEHHFIFQISDGGYKPINGLHFSFSENFSQHIDDVDIVITHAGAGTVFELLEKQKKCIVVPNYERIDKHQADLTAYVEKNELAVVCHNLNDMSTAIEQVEQFEAKPYSKDPFFFAEKIIKLFNY